MTIILIITGVLRLFGNNGIFSNLKTLETPRLTLRKLTMRDAQDIFDYSSDPQVARYVQWTTHGSIGDARAYLRYILGQYRADEPSSWGVVLKETNRVIGTAGYAWWNTNHRSAEVGYSIARSQWNKGIMTEALRAIIDFGFTQMNLNRIEAQHDVRNAASGRVMQKAGMRHEGTLCGRLYCKGEFVDVELYAILRRDW